MDDLIGKKIGGYEILDLIGHGGMASVYRAQQVSMNRIVAVKVLPRQFLNDATYMQRFNREVRIVAQLEHRNIVPVYDYGEADAQPYIVMRYMSGGSVDDLLGAGALDLPRLVAILEQIAPALDYAHSKNVLHRDLKPSNILLDGSGGAYLTDFGIARLLSDASVTITSQGVVGTPSYMSPEQAQGQPLDHRSDLYSLGVTLFEMATGQRPFESDTPYGIAVLQVTATPPAPRSLNPDLPSAVEDVILTAMRKQRDGRYNTAVELANAFKAAADRPAATMFDTQPGFPRPEMPPPARQRSDSAADGVAVITPPPPASSYAMPPVAIPASGRRRLIRRRGGNFWVSLIVGGLIGCGLLTLLTLATMVVISSVFRSATPTAEIPGGIVSPAPPTSTRSAALSALSTDTPTLAPATRTAAPSLTPTSTGGDLNPVGQRGTPMPLTDGTIVYFAERDGNFNIFRLNLRTRTEVQLTTAASIELYPAVSPDGSQVAFMSDQDGDYDLYLMDIDGHNTRKLTTNDVLDRLPAWSPDGAQIAFTSDTRGDGAHDLYALTLATGEVRLLLSSGSRSSDPQWSRDGASILFTSGSPADAGTWEINRLDVATGAVTALTDNHVKDWSPVERADGSILYLTEGDGHAALALMAADGSGSHILYDGAGYEWGARFSPSGEWITFTSDVSGRDELYLIGADGSNVRAITEFGGMGADWLPQ